MTSKGPPIRLEYTVAGVGSSFAFDPGVIQVGREPKCDLVIDDEWMSRSHATLSFEEGRWIVRDTKSANGTRVNSRRIREEALTDGDHIRFGRIDVLCSIPEEAGNRIDFVDVDMEGLMTQSIAVGDFDQLLRSVLQPEEKPADGTAKITRSPAAAGQDQDEPSALGDVAWILQVVKGTTEALVSVDELNQVLDRILVLVSEHLKMDYGVIYLCEEGLEDLEKMAEHCGRLHGETQPVQISLSVARTAVERREAVLITNAGDDERFAGIQSIVSSGTQSAVCAPLIHQGKVLGLIYVLQTALGETYNTTHLGVLSILAGLSAAAVDRARLREGMELEKQKRVRLSRYHAPAVVERIIRDGSGEMTSYEREITVLFGDIVGFTALAERLSAGEVTRILNEIFQGITDAVFDQGGTLDKFIGDAAMAFFGAPNEQTDHAERAVRAGLAMQAGLRDYNAGRAPADCLGMRIGINSGVAIVGDVGALQRKDFTCIGDAVNVASRLESTVAEEGQVVIGPRTFELLAGCMETKTLPPKPLKNKLTPIQPYLVVDPEA
ncbi:MAG: adenylate cyclase [Planctomycetota bacterium]|jgi:adenylate cyclase